MKPSSHDLPPDVLDLLRDHVPGPIDLEILLLMRSDGAKGWTASILAKRFGIPEAWAADALEALRGAALLVEDGNAAERRYFYRPATSALEASVTALAQAYAERPTDVVRTMNDVAIARVRLAALELFPAAAMSRTNV